MENLWKNEASVDCCSILKHQLINRPVSQVPSGKLSRKIQLCPDSFFRDKVRCLNLINLGRDNEIVQTQATCGSNRKLLNFKCCQRDHLVQVACWVQEIQCLAFKVKIIGVERESCELESLPRDAVHSSALTWLGCSKCTFGKWPHDSVAL